MRTWAVVLSLLIVMVSCSNAQAGRRIALVIGNSAYTNIPAVPNPRGDAEAMASLLKSVGFEVIEGMDVSAVQTSERLHQFREKADGADVALFYYSGQGVAASGTTYFLPIDIRAKSEADLKTGGAVDLEAAIEAMKGAHVRVAFFDASRNDPFPSVDRVRRGLSVGGGVAEMDLPEGSLVAFACGPGQVAEDGPKGGHSPFTQALLDNIAAPGVEIQQAMTQVRMAVADETKGRQLPWGKTDLVGSIYLNPVAPAEKK